MDARRTRIVALVALTLTAAITLLIAEFALRLLGPSSDRHYVIQPGFTRTTEPSSEHLPGVFGPSRYTVSSDGIRGEEFSTDDSEFRILAIGGSTTQNSYLDQTETWTLRLASGLTTTADGRPVWSGDVGRSGHTARSHVVQFESLIPEIPRIDVAILLVGVNDMMVALAQGTDYDPPAPLSDPEARYEQKLGAFQRLPGRFNEQQTVYLTPGTHPIKHTALYQIASQAKRTLVAITTNNTRKNFGEDYGTFRTYRRAAVEKIVDKPATAHAISVYRSYLEEIVALSNQTGVRVIFLTQPSLWRADLTQQEEDATWLGGVGDFMSATGHQYYSSSVLADAMREYNEATLDVCREQSVECIDVAAQVPKNLDMFYDDVHYTEAGSALVADIIVDYLSGTVPFKN